MCMLTFLPSGVMPNRERLFNGSITNNDGHGWAIVVGDRIETGHSMDFTAAYESFAAVRKIHPEGPAMFHSRWATGGVVDENNCHPFVVAHMPTTVLAHNGVLSLQPPKDDDRSDTRYWCDEIGHEISPRVDYGNGEIVPGIYNLNSKRGRKRLRQWLGAGNKFLILTVDPMFKRNAYLLNEQAGIWEDDGCWYSNTGYLPARFSRYSNVGETDWSAWWAKTYDANGALIVDKATRGFADDSDDCPVCQSRGSVDRALGYCMLCLTCLDCGGDVGSDPGTASGCDCYWPSDSNPGRQARQADIEAVWPPLDKGGKPTALQ